LNFIIHSCGVRIIICTRIQNSQQDSLETTRKEVGVLLLSLFWWNIYIYMPFSQPCKRQLRDYKNLLSCLVGHGMIINNFASLYLPHFTTVYNIIVFSRLQHTFLTRHCNCLYFMYTSMTEDNSKIFHSLQNIDLDESLMKYSLFDTIMTYRIQNMYT